MHAQARGGPGAAGACGGVCQDPPLPAEPGATGDTKWGSDLHIECGIKGLTTGVSALKHTLQHSRLLSKKSPLICKIISIEAAEAKQIFLYFLLP